LAISSWVGGAVFVAVGGGDEVELTEFADEGFICAAGETSVPFDGPFFLEAGALLAGFATGAAGDFEVCMAYNLAFHSGPSMGRSPNFKSGETRRINEAGSRRILKTFPPPDPVL
jgi:hypothetical protein